MRGIAAAALAAVLALAGAADARQHFPARGHRILPGGAAPLDAFATPSGAYSFRKLRSTYAGPAVRIRRASDNLETDINFLGCTGFTGCPWDEAAASAHCNATTCSGVTWYDQSGLARHLTQATPANQPVLVFNCNGFLPCFRATASTQTLVAAGSVTPASGLLSFSVVANRSAGTGACGWLRQNGTAAVNRILANTVAAQWTIAATGSIVATANDNVWHSAQAVINAASSLLSIDGADTTGSVTGGVGAGTPSISGGAGTCNWAESIVWDAYALTAGERATLTANQRSFFGTP